MFESDDRKSLNEPLFESWLEQGRSSKLGYHYLLVIWDDLDKDYKPAYASNREELYSLINRADIHESIVAVYDVYSESRIFLED